MVVEWGGHIGCGAQTRAEYQDAWRQHGPEFVEQFRKTQPGSRPLGGYLAGAWPWPPLVESHIPVGSYLVGGERVYSDHAYGLRDTNELEYLVAIGEVDAEEERRAMARIEATATERTYEWMTDPLAGAQGHE